ncbi:hypothetical protein [Jannaschia seosinensis]|nr:hypothetical protein [Jannaschia seosinensis]
MTGNNGITFALRDVLAQNAGAVGVFSDWPATVTSRANRMGL